MEKASLNLSKLAIFALLISAALAVFGEARMVVEEVVIEESKMVDGKQTLSVKPLEVVVNDNVMSGHEEPCLPIYAYCRANNSLCCEGLICFAYGGPTGFCWKTEMPS